MDKYTVDAEPFEEDEEPTWLVKQREDAEDRRAHV